MGRTQTAKALVVELSKRIQLAKQRKNELVNYINKLKESYSQEKISYARYVEIIHKHRDGKTIQEWIEYYNEYIKDCEKGIRQERKKIIKKNIAIVLFSVILIPLIIISLFQFGPTFVGFVVQEQAQEFSQIINLDFNESTTYEWQLENLGQLISAKISGNIEGDGEVKVYLNDLVIYDNSKTRSGITGEVVGETSDISWFEKLASKKNLIRWANSCYVAKLLRRVVSPPYKTPKNIITILR